MYLIPYSHSGVSLSYIHPICPIFGPTKNTKTQNMTRNSLSPKYQEAMELLTKIKEGNPPPKHDKQLINTLTVKGYIQRIITYKHSSYRITTKGTDTLTEYNKVREIMEKTKEGSRPSTGHWDQLRPE